MRAPFFALYVPTYYKGAEAVRRTLQLRDAMRSGLDAHPDQIELALSASLPWLGSLEVQPSHKV